MGLGLQLYGFHFEVKFLSNMESAGHTCYTIEITHGGSRWQQAQAIGIRV